MNSGIYIIINTKNGMVYIGQSKNIDLRWTGHRSKLKLNEHPNHHLQNAWNKYGQDAFEFGVLEHCTIEQLDEREQFYINAHKAEGNYYNVQTDVKPVKRGTKQRHENQFVMWARGDKEWVAKVKAAAEQAGMPMQDYLRAVIDWGMENVEIKWVVKGQ